MAFQPIAPEEFASHSAYDLLSAASRGHLGIDQRFLHAILDDPDRTFPDVLRFANEDHEGDRVDISADVINILSARPSLEALPFLIREFERMPEDVPDSMLEILAHIGAQAVEPLLASNAPPEEAGFLLAALGVRDQRIIDFIAKLAGTNPGEAAFLFEIYADPAARPIVESLRDRAPEEVERALVAMADTGPHPDLKPTDIYPMYPERASPEFAALSDEDLLAFLNSPCDEYRLEALETCCALELPDSVWDRVIEIARDDSDPKIRGAAFESLREQLEDDRVRDLLHERAAQPDLDPWELAGVAGGLVYDGDFSAFDSLVKRVYDNPETRSKALRAMWRSMNPSFAEFMPRHLDDPDMAVREAAVAGVGFYRMREESLRLPKYFSDPDLRLTALHAYAMAAPAKEDPVGLSQLRKRIETLAEGFGDDDEYAVDDAIAMRKILHAAQRESVEEVANVLADPDPKPSPVKSAKVGRNDPCPCGSGKKYKKCCGG